MIFVTVGTAHFDPLVREMDRLVGEGAITEPVVAQIGRGSYVPRNMRYFRFLRSLEPAYRRADVIVSAGGAGTTMECVKRGLRLVVVENTTLMEGHQAQLIGEMARRGHLIWCKDVSQLAECIDEARSKTFVPFVSDPPRVHLMIRSLIGAP
ncbi:MAG: glycosyltransferase [Candidatus Thorarchaeota archaeon]